MNRISDRQMRARAALLLVALGVLLVAGCLGVVSRAAASAGGRAATAAAAGDSPSGFWWGTDSWPVSVPGRAPYAMPFLGGAYGGYIGMTGNWAYWLGCSGQEHFLAFAAVNAAQAHPNLARYGKGVGDGAYWFMGGPGVDPHWNGTAAEARAWGARQAANALSDIAGRPLDEPVLWMDIELPGDTPARDNGWDDVYTSSCSGVVRQSSIPAAIDRADFNGFWDYVAQHSHLHPGVYSDPAVWSSIFGTGAASRIAGTDEWTYEPETRSYRTDRPRGWCLPSGGCAEFFGGVTRTSSHALMWQWSGGGGATNGIGGFNGDLDQIDGARLR